MTIRKDKSNFPKINNKKLTMDYNELNNFIIEHKKSNDRSISFVTYLYMLMDKYGFENASILYKKANISRQLWSSIISEKSHPSLNVCIKLVFALKMNNDECKLLLKKAGYTLSSSSEYALIIRYFIENSNYNLQELNEALSSYGYTGSLIY